MSSIVKTMEELYTLQVLIESGTDPSPEAFSVYISEEHENNWIRKLGLSDFTIPVIKDAATLSANNRFDVLAAIGVSDEQHEPSGKENVHVMLVNIEYDPDADPGEKITVNLAVNTAPTCNGTCLTLVTVGLSHSINR